MTDVTGLHHVTAIAGDPQENVDFYVGVLGLRMVKRSVNQDVPDTYHLFFADGAGNPGTELTFFSWAEMPPVRPGTGQWSEVSLMVPPGSLEAWLWRLERFGVAIGERHERFGEPVVPFRGPHGLNLALVETEPCAGFEFEPWEQGPVPEEYQIRGLAGVRLIERDPEATERVLRTVLGAREVGAGATTHATGTETALDGAAEVDGGEPVGAPAGAEKGRSAAGAAGTADAGGESRPVAGANENVEAGAGAAPGEPAWRRFEVGSGGGGCRIDLRTLPDARRGQWGVGGIHHVAWRVAGEAEQLRAREAIRDVGGRPTDVVDRTWFRSVYFLEPGGALVEIATDGPGFTVDEAADELGGRLALTDWLEPQRERIEAALTPLEVPSLREYGWRAEG